MWYTEDIERTLTIGNVTLQVKLDIDSDTDLSYLGKFSNFQYPKLGEKLVHRDSQSVMGHDFIWRDENGRIVPEPEEPHYANEYQYTFHDNAHEKIKYALQDSKRLEDYNNGILCDYVILVTVFSDGNQIGFDSLGGIQSDSEESYIRATVREVALQAVQDAKQWRQRNMVA